MIESTEEARALLVGMLTAAREAMGCAAGYDYDDFALDETLFEEIADRLAFIGDAAKRLPPEVKAAAPGVDWRDLASLRDALYHSREVRDGLPAVSAAVLWDMATSKLPLLTGRIEDLLRRLEA